MSRVRYRVRGTFLPPLVLGAVVLITIFIIINGTGTLFRDVFYGYRVTDYGNPGSYLSTVVPNESYCHFRYGLPEQLIYEEDDLVHPFEEKEKSEYRILRNVIKANTDSSVPEVTYASHVTADFINYVAEIVRFWEGPISIAAFVPDFDADLTLVQLNQLCCCTSGMSRVSVHFIFPVSSPPQVQDQSEISSCQLPDSSRLLTYRAINEISYPINVARNIARNFAATHFVMVSDVQLIPSHRLVSKFIIMVNTLHVKQANPPSRVFVVPVFEVDACGVIPRTKEELVKMIKNEKAVYFHRHICPHCQKFPGIKTWVGTNPTEPDVKQFWSVKREYPFHRWEPIYIGSKSDPLYSEALSWDGLQDKMTQVLEMCLIGYQFVILDGAFLVHWPGIKRQKHNFKDSWRASYRKENSKQYSNIINKLRGKYEENPKCKLQ